MSNLLETDKELINKERSNLKLLKPSEFIDEKVKDRITPELIDKLMLLVELPFQDSSLRARKDELHQLQLTRLQEMEMFRKIHIYKIHRVLNIGVINNQPNT